MAGIGEWGQWSMKFKNEDIGAKILEIITSGLYDGNLNCLREYVQNSIDAKANLIEISFENSRDVLQIKDNGLGMNKEELERAVQIGISEKTPDDIGWRGIGFWSGVPVSKRIVVVTKKEDGKKLRLKIDNDLFRLESNSNKPAIDVLTAATGDIEELPIGRDEIHDHYSIIRLESILRQQKEIFKDEYVTDYLSRTVPVAFDKNVFPLAPMIDDYLRSKKVPFPEVEIKYQGEQIHRPPTKIEMFIDRPIKRDFTINGEVVATSWILTTKENLALKEPNAGIVFKKKGFTIGDENLVSKEFEGTYHRWQFGEIHILSGKLRENAARNNFEHNNEILAPFLDQVAEFIKELQGLNRYLSDRLLSGEIRIARKAIEKEDFSKTKIVLKKASDKLSRQRKFPDDAAIKQIKGKVESISSQQEKQIERIRSKYAQATAKAAMVSGRERLQKTIDSLHPSLKRKMKGLNVRTARNLVTTPTDGLVQLLRKKTGMTSNELHVLSCAAYDWEVITAKNNSKGPRLTLMGQFKSNEHKLANRNRNIGVMTYAIHDLFVNQAKHCKGEECFSWYEKASDDEKDNLCADMLATVDLMYRLIEKSQSYKP